MEVELRMSGVGEWVDLESRISGKWQVPALAISLVLLTAATLRHRTTSRQATVADALAQLESLQSDEQHDRVVQIGTRILDRKLGSAADRAAIELAVARSRSDQAAKSGGGPAAAELILDAYRSAEAGGAILEAGDLRRIAEAHEWAGRLGEAVAMYAKAIERGVPEAGALRRHVFELLPTTEGGEAGRAALLDDVLNRGDSTAADRIWALTQKLYLLHETGQSEAAGGLVAQAERELSAEGRGHAAAYLRSLHLYLSKDLDEAERLLRELRNGLDPWFEEHAKSGWLLGRVLLAKGGRQNLEAANSFFNDVILHHPRGEYSAASRLAIGEVLSQWELHAEASEAYAAGVNLLPGSIDRHVVDRDELRVRLSVLAESRRQAGDFRIGLEYARLVLLLVDAKNREQVAPALRQVAELQFQLADQLRTRGVDPLGEQDGGGRPSNEEIRSLYEGAARTFLRLADLGNESGAYSDGPRWTAAEMARQASELRDQAELEDTGLLLQHVAQSQADFAAELERAEAAGQTSTSMSGDAKSLYAEAAGTLLQLSEVLLWDEKRSAEAHWRAAELYGKAGRTDRAVELFRSYAAQRPSDAMVPRALYLAGYFLDRAGRHTAAAEAYQECFRRFPRTLEGARALLPLARCYLRMGADADGLAERTLRLIVDESEVFTPQAPEFSEALFMLGELLHRRGTHERAVEVLEEALARSPEHANALDAKFLLADAYRQSAIGLKRELASARLSPTAEWARSELVERLRKARELYRGYVREVEAVDSAELGALQRQGQRLAALYEADCLFEAQDYRSALQRYESIVAVMKGTPSALAASVQAINCHVFLGEPEEARKTLLRAKAMLEEIPAGAFGEPIAWRSREDWRKYFDWLGESGLF